MIGPVFTARTTSLPDCDPFASFEDLLKAGFPELAICRGLCDDASFVQKGWVQTNRKALANLSQTDGNAEFFRTVLVMADHRPHEAATMWDVYNASNTAPYCRLAGLVMSAQAHRNSGADHTAIRLIQEAWNVCGKKYAWVEVLVAKYMGGASKYKDKCLCCYKSFIQKLEEHMDTSNAFEVIGVHAYYECAMQVFVCSCQGGAVQYNCLPAAAQRQLRSMRDEMKSLKEKGDALKKKPFLVL